MRRWLEYLRWLTTDREARAERLKNKISAEGRHPVNDERIMCDGRPAYAWWNEIQMLRRREPELDKRAFEINERFKMLRIAEWVVMRDYNTFDVLIRFRESITAEPSDLEGNLSVEPLHRAGQFEEGKRE